MRVCRLILGLYLAAGISICRAVPNDNRLLIRQATTESGPPPLSGTSTASATASVPTSSIQATATPSDDNQPSSSTATVATTDASSHSNTASSTFASSSTIELSAIPTVTGNSTASNGTSTISTPIVLPLEPSITPALGVSGAILILTGVVYAIIGIKNRWIHVYLSTAYLTSLSILVLIVYVMNPPVSNAIQGAYFVGIIMTGLIFGGGALIFKEVTEGLGCLLGGFCLAMWFLTLKAGGVITNTTGKAIFIAIFCVVSWAFSFSRYTRSYALIGATSFSGATAFILGVDCFSKAGLKEFWVYIWALNDNLFPLNTSTYPITRGTRVESIVIVLGCIIGIISQIKLWKVVRDRHKQREEERLEGERQRDAVDEALGRHLQKQNDRDKSEWEKRYGNRLAVSSKRNTVLWTDAHPEKRFSTLSAPEVNSSQTSSSDSLEMSNLAHMTSRTSLVNTKGNRQSAISVQAIPEVEEDEVDKPVEATRNSTFIEPGRNSYLAPMSFEIARSPLESVEDSTVTATMSPPESLQQKPSLPSLRPQSVKPPSGEIVSRLHLEPEDRREKKRSSRTSLNNLKRRSFQSLLPKTKDSSNRDVSPSHSMSSPDERFSESKEALITPTEPIDTVSHHSRASSVAATVDEDNEKLDLADIETSSYDGRRPDIVVSSVGNIRFNDPLRRAITPSAELAEDELEADPEEMVRPLPAPENKIKSPRSSQDVNETTVEDGIKSSGDASHPSTSEGLTQDALQRVPSQISHVVLSYRTNEWAKHIANADAPIYEEPDPVIAEDDELPTHLADPASPSAPNTDKASPAIEKPPELPSPLVAAAPSFSGIKVNPEIQPPEKVYASPLSETAPPMKKHRPASGEYFPMMPSTAGPRSPEQELQEFIRSAAPAPGIKRAMTDPNKVASLSKNIRRMSNPLGRQATLQSMIIDENEEADFAPRNSKRNSLNGPLPGSGNHSSLNLSNNPYRTSIGQYSSTNNINRMSSTSSLNLVNHTQISTPLDMKRSSTASNLGLANVYPSSSGHNQNLLQSATRLSSVPNSHQPVSRHNPLGTDQARREALMADWRLSNHHSANVEIAPKVQADTRRAQMLFDREQEKARKEREQTEKAMREAAFDQGMRSQGMIDAHKEVMRKMQRQAGKKI